MALSVFIITGGDNWAMLTYEKITDEEITKIAEWYAWGLMHWPDQKTTVKGLSDENAEKVRQKAKNIVQQDKQRHVLDEQTDTGTEPAKQQPDD